MAAAAQQPPQQQTAPQLSVLGQYIKDFSFENPNAPRSLAPTQTAAGHQHPDQCRRRPSSRRPTIEVALKLEGKAESEGTVLFAFDLTFAGIFRIQNVPQEHLAAAGHDRMPAAAVPVRARDRRHRGAQWRLRAAAARSGRFRRALPAAPGSGAGRAGDADTDDDVKSVRDQA